MGFEVWGLSLGGWGLEVRGWGFRTPYSGGRGACLLPKTPPDSREEALKKTRLKKPTLASKKTKSLTQKALLSAFSKKIATGCGAPGR